MKTASVSQVDLISLLSETGKAHKEFSDFSECEKTANSIIDIIELGEQIDELVAASIENKDVDIVPELEVLIGHLCFHIQDSKFMHRLFQEELAQREARDR